MHFDGKLNNKQLVSMEFLYSQGESEEQEENLSIPIPPKVSALK